MSSDHIHSLPLDEILDKLRQGMADILGDRLAGIYLYGSHAREEACAESDIDVLIVLYGQFDYFDLVLETNPLTASLSLEYDVVISQVFATREQLESESTPLLMNVLREGTPV